MRCPRCHAEAPETSLFCGACGTPLQARPSNDDEDAGVTILPARPVGHEGKTSVRAQATPKTGPTPRVSAARDDEDGAVTLLPTRPIAEEAATIFGGPTTPPPKPAPPPANNRDEDDEDGGVTIVPGTQASAPGTDTGPLSPGQSFGRRYHIIKLLGLGGMGAVYQAWDAELGVSVALKVIRPEAAADDPTAARDLERRFKRELLLAREVTHKNVVRIHDLGELNGIKYITMPFLEGEDLATLLKREGRLGVPRTLAIARGILSGLAAAHQAGVVHRDLKPANIMIGADDQPLIMDFGIALSTAESKLKQRPSASLQMAAGDITGGLTSTGEIVGTVEYMAPEQARGDHVDQRADIYAVGLILYDMLLGRRRHQHANSAIAELRTRLETSLPGPRALDDSVPEALDRIVARCIAPKLEDRYQTTQELVADLDRLDADGNPLPSQRRLIHAVVAGAILLVVGMFGLNWWLVTSRAPVKPHDPVSVLIADFKNTTGDPAFDHMLEPILRLGLEGTNFINAYDRSRVRQAFGIPAPEKLDEASARQIAMKQGVGVVLSGTIGRSGDGYEISMKAIQPISAGITASAKAGAATREQVLASVTKLAATVRKALGEKASEADQLFAMRSISRGSLDAISQYAAGIQLQSRGKYEEAIGKFRRAVQLDPNFGPGYNSLAVNLRNIGKVEEADTSAREALRHLDGMTERERLSTRGNYYRLTSDFQQCVKEYGELTARYPVDTVAHNNRAFCYARLRDYRRAVGELQQALQILPNHMTYRGNLALYTAYSGDFARAEREVAAIREPTADAMQPLPLSQLAQGRLEDATATYQKMATMSTFGAQFAAAGMGDLAVYEGRFADAVAIYTGGAETDLKEGNPEVAAEKLAALAHAQLARGQTRAAVAAAEQALSNSKAVSVAFLTARVLVEAGALARAQRIAAGLSSELATEPQAYGKIIEGEIALKQRNLPEAIKILGEANAVLDTWVAHLDLGRTYLAGNAFAQADSEFDRCIQRRGEALMLTDQDPTYGYLPPVYYYLGRAREGLGTAGYADLYREYLKIRGKSTEDPLVPDARRRLGQ